MSQTTYQRNAEILKAYCEGKSTEDLCEQYNMTKVMLQAAMRQALATIKEHTEYNAEVSFDVNIFPKNKKAILHYMQARIPTTSLTQNAKKVLKETFGEYYGQHPDKVYQGWADFPLIQSRYHHYRDLESVRTWLASEGYFVDDYLNQPMINQIFTQMLDALKTLPQNNSLNITISSESMDKRVTYFDAEITQSQHQARRRFKLELLPAY